MKNLISLLSVLCAVSVTHAQTTNYLFKSDGSSHIPPLEISGVYEANGDVGIGTAAPSSKLHIVGSLTMVDGNEENGFVLTSNASGVGSWQAPKYLIGSTSGITFVPTALPQSNETWLGANAGYSGGSTAYTVFIGLSAGGGATDADYANFIGNSAGAGATYATSSVFIGREAGAQATNASYANFIGEYAGYQATNAQFSNFIGKDAGYQAMEARRSNFIGGVAGMNAQYAERSNFIGWNAGYQATYAGYSNFIGHESGYQAEGASSANFVGEQSGYQAASAVYANYYGQQAGYKATNADRSNFFGYQTGYEATNADHSIFMGNEAGLEATDADHSNFTGNQAGYQATDASNSNFYGDAAGYIATNAEHSTFIGTYAGWQATNAAYSNFIGDHAGESAANADHSIFLGNEAGGGSAASHSIFIGNKVGEGVTTENSIFIGNQSGQSHTGDNSIIIGNSATGQANSISIGNSASNTTANQFAVGATYTNWQIAGVDYEMPVTQATGAGQVLSNNGSGILSWEAATEESPFTRNSDEVYLRDELWKVGIGTSTPTARLQVIGECDPSLPIIESRIPYSGCGTDVPDYFVASKLMSGPPPSFTAKKIDLVIKGNGKVGVGTSSPTARVDAVEGCDDVTIVRARFNEDCSNGNYFLAGQPGGANPVWAEYYAEHGVGPIGIPEYLLENVPFVVKGGGNVGIGTYSPSAQLDILSKNIFDNVLLVHNETQYSNLLNVTKEGYVGVGRTGHELASLRVSDLFSNAVPQFVIDGGNVATPYFMVHGSYTSIGIASPTLDYSTLGLKGINGTSFDIFEDPSLSGWVGQIRFIRDNGSTAPVRHVIADDFTSNNLVLNPGLGGGGAGVVQINGKLQVGNHSITSGSHANASLFVDGKIAGKACVVTINSWADEVFSENYNLLPLSDLESFIKEKKHLPEIPSECEVLDQGISLGDMQATLLKKIEELTLHAIRLLKEVDNLKKLLN